MFAREPENVKLRRAAVSVARMTSDDREWILAQLTPAERGRLATVINAPGESKFAQAVGQAADAEASQLKLQATTARAAFIQLLARSGDNAWLAARLLQAIPASEQVAVIEGLGRRQRKRVASSGVIGPALTATTRTALLAALDEVAETQVGFAMSPDAVASPLRRFLMRVVR